MTKRPGARSNGYQAASIFRSLSLSPGFVFFRFSSDVSQLVVRTTLTQPSAQDRAWISLLLAEQLVSSSYLLFGTGVVASWATQLDRQLLLLLLQRILG